MMQSSRDLDRASLDGMPLCQSFDLLHAEWERAAWESAGLPALEARRKRDLLLWKLHGMLAAATRELPHAYESALRRPDLPTSHAALCNGLLHAGRQHDALEHIRQALEDNPLDMDAARICWQVFGMINHAEGRRQLCEDQRLLVRAAPHLLAMENWFMEPRPKGNELASVLVVCAGPLERTQRCLESVLAATRAPYELVLVDNGCEGAARTFLESVRRRPGPVRVELVRNVKDAGVAKACNQALARARGEYVVLLDQDAIVTPGWLEGLIALSLFDWPNAALVGPVTNTGPGPQAIEVDYENVRDVNDFVARRRRAWIWQMSGVPYLAGFCVLMHREVLQRLGGFDHQFQMRRFAVGDLCLRARDIGLRSLVAQDIFVHQEVAPSDPNAADADLQALQKKWGAEQVAVFQQTPTPVPQKDAWAEAIPLAALGSAGTEPPAPPQARAAEPAKNQMSELAKVRQLATKPGVSLCMIVRNEENNLPACLATVKDLFSEIVVVDTGSTDNTRQAAQKHGAKVFEFPWVDSFGAARNESIRHATCKWIMWLDADDRLDDVNRERIRKVFSSLGNERDAYAVQVRSVLDGERTMFRMLDQVRIFRNLPEINWEYRIHEQILPTVNRAGGVVRWTDIIVDHVGYQDAEVRRRKLERNLRLLEMNNAEQPDDSFTLFNLGWTLLDLDRIRDAQPRLRRSLETAKPDSSILRKLYHLLAVAQRQLGSIDEALKICADGLQKYPDDAELLLENGLMLRDRGDLIGAELNWSRLFEPKHGQYFSSEEVGLRGFRTRQLLAELFVGQQRWTEAEVQWCAALEERLDFEPAWMGLAELYTRAARWTDLEALLRKLDANKIGGPKVSWLRARAQVQRREFSAARSVLSEVITQDPRAIGPRALLSQILLQEGQDWPAAEKALLDVLDIDPANQDALHNLQILRRQHGPLNGETALAK